MESERRDALAVSARAMPASAWTCSPYPRSEELPHLVPNHGHKNRCESICRESRVNICLTFIQRPFCCACERGGKARVKSKKWQCAARLRRDARKTTNRPPQCELRNRD